MRLIIGYFAVIAALLIALPLAGGHRVNAEAPAAATLTKSPGPVSDAGLQAPEHPEIAVESHAV